MKVKEFMTSQIQWVTPNDPIQKAAQIMKSVNCGSVPVCEGTKPVGIITDRDIAIKAVASNKMNANVKECMTNQVITCTSDTDAHEAADLMATHQIRRLPVVDASGNLVGICSIGDLATVDIHVNEAGDALSRISEQTNAPNALH